MQEPLFAFGTHSPPKTFSPMFGASPAAPRGAAEAAGMAEELEQGMDLDD
jgi:hypothetical protein